MNMNAKKAGEISEIIISTFQDKDVPIRDSLIIMVGVLASIQKTLGVSKEYFWGEVTSLGNEFSGDLDGAHNEH
jgi:hypothetical protein